MGKKQPTLAELRARIDELNRQAEVMRVKEKAEIVAKMQAAISTYGITPEDLFSQKRKPRSAAGVTRGTKKAAAKKSRSSSPRFRHGEHVWTGRGPRPTWLRELVDAGHSADEFRVSK